MNEIIIKLNAGNDKNGNPRRVFVVLDPTTGATIDIIDEGYNGDAEPRKRYPNAVRPYREFATTTKEYRELLKKKI